MLSNIAEKIANNGPLSLEEQTELRMAFSDLEEVRLLVKTWQRAGDKGIRSEFVKFPFTSFYSNVLIEDTVSVKVVIPQEFRHLEIFIAGRVNTNGDTSNKYDTFYVEVNDDTAENYKWNSVNGLASSVTASQDLTANAVLLGDLQTENATSGLAGVIKSTVFHYTSSYQKGFVSAGGLPLTVTDTVQLLIFGQWEVTDSIKSLTFRGNTLTHPNTKIAAGTAISVCGIL